MLEVLYWFRKRRIHTLIDSSSLQSCSAQMMPFPISLAMDSHSLRDFPILAGEDLAKSFCSSEQVQVAPQLHTYTALCQSCSGTAQHLCAQLAAGSVLGLPSSQCPGGESRRPWEDAFLAK